MFGDKRVVDPVVRPKSKRRKKPFGRQAALRLEQLEERLTLSTNPTLSIPTTLVGARGGVVAVPIDVNQLTDNLSGFLSSGISGASTSQLFPTLSTLQYINCTRAGLSSADFAVNFDPNVFSVSRSDVHLGTLPSNSVAQFPFSLQPNSNPPAIGWTVTAGISPTNPGQLNIHIASNNQYANIISTTATSSPVNLSDLVFETPSSTPTGPVVGSIESLVTIDFHIKSTAAIGRTQINLAASNAAGTRPTEMFDATGRKYTLGPAPTNGSADIGVDGTLTVLPTAPTTGTWTQINVTTPTTDPTVAATILSEGIGHMLMLPDGSVMAQGGSDFPTADWFRLTPDVTGNYANGTWTQLASMNIGRLFFGSVVMQDGRVLVLGGEFSFNQSEDPTGEIYDPATNTWTLTAPFPVPLFDPSILSQNPPVAQRFGDSSLELMSDGTVLAASTTDPLVLPGSKFGTTQSPSFRYDPVSDTWTQDATPLNSDSANEEGWTKLPDGSILAIQIFGTHPGNAQRLVLGDTPADDQWVPAGHVPVNLFTSTNLTIPFTLNAQNFGFAELGPGTLLPDGRVFYIGATSNTALYTPPTPGNPQGTWVAGPRIPGGFGANDGAAAVLSNGRVLFAAANTPLFTGGTHLFEFDPATNQIYPVSNPPTTPANFETTNVGQFNVMMAMPTGQVMMTDLDAGVPATPTTPAIQPGIFLYTPAGGPQDSWRPTISSITPNGSTTTFTNQVQIEPFGTPPTNRTVISSVTQDANVYTLTGTQLNGLNEGAYYGDDHQQATNYPIVQLVDMAGNVVDATTFNWSTAGVATGSTLESVDFALPTTLNTSTPPVLSDFVSVRVIANGISSAPTGQIINLGAGQEDITLRVDPTLVDPTGNKLVDIFSGTTLVGTHPNNPNSGAIDIVGDANNNSVIIDQSNGIVNVPVNFDGGGAAFVPPGDEMRVLGAPGNDKLVITPTSDTTGSITDNGSAPYTFTNISSFAFDGEAGTNAVTLNDTLGGAALNVNGATVDYNGGTPYVFNNTDTLAVLDNSAAGGDAINVLATVIPTTIGSTSGAGGDHMSISSDAPVNQVGNLDNITAAVNVTPGAGKNTLEVSDFGSTTAGLTVNVTSAQITSTDLAAPIGTFAPTRGGTINVILDGSNFSPTTFIVTSTLPALNTLTLNGGAVDGNEFDIGSTAGANNGRLNNLPSAIVVNGSGTDVLEVDDHGTTGAYNYNVTDTSVNYDAASSPAPATFGGVTYSGIQSLQLDATERPNAITVAPSLTTVMTINAYGQVGGADSLAINTTNVSGSATNNITGGGPVSFDGFYSFDDGHQDVNYTNIENFPAPTALINFPILAYSADASPTSRPVVTVVNAQTGAVVSSFTPTGYAANYTGGVSIAVGYFDGSGQPEIAVAPGRNHSPTIEVFDAFGNLLFQFQAYAANFVNGINIAAGNVEGMTIGGQEVDDIVTVPAHGVSDVRVWHNQFPTSPGTPVTLYRDFNVFGTSFIGGSTVAVADLNRDGLGDVIVGSGPGMQPLIEGFDVSIPRTAYTPFRIYFPFAATFRGGVNVSAINPQANSNFTAPMIVAGQASSGTGQVIVLNGTTGTALYSTSFGVNTGVRTAAKVVAGRLNVFAAVPVSGQPSRIKRIDPVSASVVDFILESDLAFSRMFLA